MFFSQSAGVVDCDIPDNCAVFRLIESPNLITEKMFHKQTFDKSKFCRLISCSDSSESLSTIDHNAAYNNLSRKIFDAVTACRALSCKEKAFNVPGNPLLTDWLLSSIRKQSNVRKKVRRQPFNMPP